ncbi:MAG: hypothetical protein Q7K42_01700 [Candidatus Diapherotrites archaeon]|nr:hypothetical protein [Candidatus Diapherotrites archaeon]
MRLRSSIFGGLGKKQRQRIKSLKGMREQQRINRSSKKKDRPSVMQQIESSKGIKELEMGWFKKPRFSLSPALGIGKKLRRPRSVNLRLVADGETANVHTHLFPEETFDALPSFADYVSHLDDMLMSKVYRTMIISVIDKKGYEIGRTFVYLPSRFRAVKNSDYANKISELIKTVRKFKNQRDQIGLRNLIEQSGFKFRFVAADFNFFDKIKNTFVTLAPYRGRKRSRGYFTELKRVEEKSKSKS